MCEVAFLPGLSLGVRFVCARCATNSPPTLSGILCTRTHARIGFTHSFFVGKKGLGRVAHVKLAYMYVFFAYIFGALCRGIIEVLIEPVRRCIVR